MSTAACTCGHGAHVHIAYVGGCWLCACTAYQAVQIVYATNTDGGS